MALLTGVYCIYISRSKQILGGPKLPISIHFPCTINIDEEIIFIIGPHVTTSGYMVTQSSMPAAYLFNQTDETYKNVPKGGFFPCSFSQSVDTKFTCAYLSHENSVVVGVDFCTTVLNLTSLKWMWNSTFKMEYRDGIIFNHDEEREAAIYIGTNRFNGTSAVYQVFSVL